MTINTVEEAIQAAHYTVDNSRLDDVMIFLRNAPTKDILTFIQRLTIVKHDMYMPFARAILDIRLAEDAERTAQKLVTGTDNLITQTNRLVNLTRGLYVLTIILILLGSLEFVKFLFGLICQNMKG